MRLRVAALLALLAAPPAAAAVPGWTRLDVAATGRPVWVYVPTTLTAPATVPLVVFLHGSGSRPTDWLSLLEPWAEEQRCVLALPQAVANLAFGVGADEVTIEHGLELTAAHLATAGYTLDRDRVGLAGHSAGGAYALLLGYSHPGRWSAIWALGAPYRPFVDLADPVTVPPARLYYGDLDPNYTGGSYTANRQLLERLGVPTAVEIASGSGHSGWADSTFRDGFAFLLAQRYDPPGPCQPSATRLCLRQGRFAVTASWATTSHTGQGQVVAAQEGDSGLFWFFAPTNWELTVKVLDGCAVNGSFWVFFSALSNVEYELTVDDLATGARRTYANAAGSIAPATLDTSAFPCP
jgi:predicted esterase